MKRWWLDCPYCGARLLEGTGGGDEFPKIWIPFFRCSVCGQIIETGSKEYINIPMQERLKIRSSLTNSQDIAESLDRTNNKDYEKILRSHGYKFYPLTDEDYKKFKNVDWKKYINSKASYNATQSLYNAGILIKEEDLDKETGGIKKEKIIENKRNYEINKKSIRVGSIAGLIVGFLSCCVFGCINPNSYLFLLGILFGFITYFFVASKTSEMLNKNIQSNSSNNGTSVKSSEITKNTLKNENIYNICPHCGMQVFDDEEKCSNCNADNSHYRK